VRVLDFGHILAGPYCARLLADLGADVVKVESRRRVEGMGRTRLGPSWQGRRDRSPHMLMVNRNKRSVTLDLKTPAGVDTARRLAAVADVLVENFSAGTMARLGLGWRDLRAANPRLVYLSLSGYGHEGPRREWTSMNLNLQAYSGLMMATGAEGDPPTTIAASWNDYLGALHGCIAVLNALVERNTTGQGAHLDLSQFECSVASLGPLLLASQAGRPAPPRLGNRSAIAAPQGCYRCAGADEWCAISIQTDRQWQALAATLELADPRFAGLASRREHDQGRDGAIELPSPSDPRFASLAGRREHHDEVDALIEGWTTQRTGAEVEARLRAAGVPAERLRRSRDVLADPVSSRLFPPLEDPPGQRQLMSALPFSAGSVPLKRSPHVGEHTTSVLEEWLRLTSAEIEQLEAAEALV
jgi:crotonobetainyl-CoA:carnitine CoA-transferase CaiB-like acyl-CoA transferase